MRAMAGPRLRLIVPLAPEASPSMLLRREILGTNGRRFLHAPAIADTIVVLDGSAWVA